MDKSFLMPRDLGCPTDAEMGNKISSKMESKRDTPGFIDGPELSNKKQAVEDVRGRPGSSSQQLSFYPWHNASNLQSDPVYMGSGLLGLQPTKSINLLNKDNSSVNQARELDSGVNTSMGHSFCWEADNKIGNPYGMNFGDAISPAAGTTNIIDESHSSLGYGFHNGNYNFMFMSHASNQASNGHNSGKIADCVFSFGNPFRKDDRSPIMSQVYEEADNNVIPIIAANCKGNGDNFALGLSFSKANESFITMGHPYSKASDNFMSSGSSLHRSRPSALSMESNFKYEDVNPKFRLLGNAYDYQSGQFSNSSELVTSNQISSQASAVAVVPGTKFLVKSDVNATPKNLKLGSEPGSVTKKRKGTNKKDSPHGSVTKNKKGTNKKDSPQSFPSFLGNVKRLLSTGIVEGAHVKYISWSREKSVRAVVNGTGYLCGCEGCKLSKTVNAHDLECHAGCKTKHPNSSIYFENGKNIYQVVQDLKNSPQEKLFDAIRNMMGSAINENNFGIWKDTFQTASCELPHNYGKDDI